MSALVKLYLSSTDAGVVACRNQASGQQGDPAYFDLQSQFQGAFEVDETQGMQTQYSTYAQQYYSVELSNILLPAGFIPINPGVPLNQWNPSKPYTTSDALGF